MSCCPSVFRSRLIGLLAPGGMAGVSASSFQDDFESYGVGSTASQDVGTGAPVERRGARVVREAVFPVTGPAGFLVVSYPAMAE